MGLMGREAAAWWRLAVTGTWVGGGRGAAGGSSSLTGEYSRTLGHCGCHLEARTATLTAVCFHCNTTPGDTAKNSAPGCEVLCWCRSCPCERRGPPLSSEAGLYRTGQPGPASPASGAAPRPIASSTLACRLRDQCQRASSVCSASLPFCAAEAHNQRCG